MPRITTALQRAIGGLGIHPTEKRAVGLLVLVFGFGEAGRGLGMNAGDALFFVRYGVDRLPWMYMALGALTFLAVLFYAAGMARFGWQFLHGLYVGVALLLIVGRFLIPAGVAAIYPALWLSVHVISWVLVTAAWSLAGKSFDTRQAKRLFSLLASASIIGGITGNALTGWLAETIGTENLFLAYASLLLLALLAVRQLTDDLGEKDPKHSHDGSPLDDVMTGFRTLKRSRLLQLIVISSVLFSILYFSVWFPFNQVISEFYPNEAALAGFLGNFTSVVMLTTLLLSLASNRIYARFGVVNVVLVVALIYLAGFSVWLVEFSFFTAIALRFGQLVWLNGAGWSAWNALFNVFHSKRREQLRAFESGVPSQIGTSLSGVLLLLGERVLTTQQIFLMGGAAALICVIVTWRMRPAYGQTLLEAIRGGLVDVFTGSPGGLGRMGVDSQARQTLVKSLADPDPNVRRISASLLGTLGLAEPEQLAPLLGDDSPLVRQAALESLAEVGTNTKVELISPLRADPSPAVRRAALLALEKLNSSYEWLDEMMEDDVPMVRAEAAAVLLQRVDTSRGQAQLRTMLQADDEETCLAALRTANQRELELPLADLRDLTRADSAEIRQYAVGLLAKDEDALAQELVLAAMEDEDQRVRAAATAAASSMQIEPERLFERIEEGPIRAQKAALVAWQMATAADRERLINWTLIQVSELEKLTHQRQRLVQAAHSNGRQELALIADLLERRQSAYTELVLQALSKLGPEEALDLVERGLAADDRELRTQAIEALESLMEPSVVRAFIPLLEAQPQQGELPALGRVLQELSRSPDPWIRAFALRIRADQLRSQLGELQTEVKMDDSDIVHQVWNEVSGQIGGPMKPPIDSLTTMERVLHLRRIPIFEGLDPDDLHRIAQISEERTIPDGDYLCREGMLEDELYLIVEGQVSITKNTDEGERELRKLGEGQPVGELAILTSQPRSASARAIGSQLKVLVVDGDDFQAILRDRPQVSTAMLANLAKRLSTLV